MASLNCFCLDEIPLTKAALQPFLSFGRLTELCLHTPCTKERCSFQLNDSIISELAEALPRLRSLQLGSFPCGASTSDVTITSLVALSTNCVDLDYLRLHFDANNIISRNTHANSQTHKFVCKLRTLSVDSQLLPSDHNDILLVAFTILHIFPHLETISGPLRRWDRVREAVHLFQKAQKIIPFPTSK